MKAASEQGLDGRYLRVLREGLMVGRRSLDTAQTLVEVLKYAELNHSLSYCEILFSDNGIGFDDRYKEKIFEMFQRLHRRQDYSGTGIGLALCKRIVVNHGGVIFGESRKGAGTLFHIILPLNLHHPTIDLLPGYVE